MNFYTIHEGFYEGIQARIDQLRAACETRNVAFHLLNSLEVDYSNLPNLGKGDLLYNMGRGSAALESLLLSEEVTTFYIKNPLLIIDNSDTVKYTFIHHKEGLPQPKTIFQITADRNLLRKYVDFLGGFPVVLKAYGSTRGIGTIKMESLPALFSTVDYLVNTGARFILREFIEAEYVGRCRVLGNQVIQTYAYPLLPDDFRNASVPFEQMPDIVPTTFNDAVKNDCIRAAHLANTELAAVDVLLDKQGRHFILEVNSPAGLPLKWQETGNPLALSMLNFLLLKSNTHA